ncbi:hypothetical protein P168DRAFT_319300 [Aspergillus campestris IBT 28561]|uniref:Uncharacterized protein n=1 Tax=Aspergillus campestris (strain IBT 28561) TaxID=1392248 RepID=A0A2I1D1U2_ASPC2|nr:uncharacterized protein P168DRAFT_319300 [Aspergillus campestris IBT 28561]PKY03840.1 hypothetical protein P168DRAFT_319300 [Aspergillus campestris IBT 28561]
MFQALIARSRQQVINLINRLQPPPDRRRPTSGHIPVSSLRYQLPVWVTAGGGMYATLHGVYLMMRAFRNLRYINTPEPTLLNLVFDRQALHPSPAETAQFGTDDQVAQHPSSFDPSITAPEREFLVLDEECRVGGEADPLLVSPANREVSRLLSPTELGRAVQGGVKTGPSARGWTNKHGVVRVRAVSVPGGGKEVEMEMGMGKKVKRGRGMSVGGGRALGVDRYERLLRGLREVQRRSRGGVEG